MKTATRTKFTQYTDQIAKLNAIASAVQKFTVTPSVQQTLEKRIQESSEFLKRITILPVDELEGEKIGLGVSGTIAGRTNTTADEREPRDVSDLSKGTYKCAKTDFDTAIPYAKLDAWAKFPEFQSMLRDAILQQQALDRIMIGFNGTSAAAATNRAANPLLQDVNIGWIEHVRVDAPARLMSEVVAASDEIRVGKNGDYENLDALVYDGIQLLDPVHRRRPDLVVLIGRELMHDKYLPLINREQTAENALATDVIISQRRVGGLPAVEVPFIPEGTVIITCLTNLAIYWQEGGRRRVILDNPKRDRIENFESSNDAYVIEDYGLIAVIENIELGEWPVVP
ncbi:phage major capsid protein, P2 family [Perlucidibaca piscinae]|uniref:phage major capsid protein, P2 family n=1 Tax=Perlucidibaca piscinae TaxID=392589 RepID=UPI0003B6D953|nr:phage major capsid protein, P2 family [Perlucidibaca piscinae]